MKLMKVLLLGAFTGAFTGFVISVFLIGIIEFVIDLFSGNFERTLVPLAISSILACLVHVLVNRK